MEIVCARCRRVCFSEEQFRIHRCRNASGDTEIESLARSRRIIGIKRDRGSWNGRDYVGAGWLIQLECFHIVWMATEPYHDAKLVCARCLDDLLARARGEKGGP